LLFALLAVSSAVCFASAILAPVDERAVAGEDERRNHTGNICDDEDDGQQCHDNGVAMCHREYTRSYTKCAFYEECVGLKPSGAVCREDACAYKADGWHCHEGHVVECRMSVTVNVTSCAFYEDCEKDPLVPNAASCRGYVCEHKPNGTHCKDDHVLTCEGGLTVSATKCGVSERCAATPAVGMAMAPPSAVCAERDCMGRVDGAYCTHGGLLECQGGRGSGFRKCPFYQQCSEMGGPGAAQCTEDACDDHADGWRCKGSHRVQCMGLRTVDFQLCPDFVDCQDGKDGRDAQCVGYGEGSVSPIDAAHHGALPAWLLLLIAASLITAA